MIEYLDSVYDIAIGFDASKNSSILRTHTYPLLLSKVFNFSSNEIVIIYPDKESRHLLNILLTIKHRFNIKWDTNSISELVDRVTFANIKVKGDEITLLSDQVSKYYESKIEISNTVIIWDYLLYCKQHNLISTKSVFNNFMKGIFNNTPDYDSLDQVSEIANYFSNFGKCTVISYTDLFFKLKIPSTGYLSKLKKDNICNYSKKNLDIVTQFLSVVDDTEAGRITAYIDTMYRYLKSAMLSRNNVICFDIT
jgi:hypothetical protein